MGNLILHKCNKEVVHLILSVGCFIGYCR